MAGTDPDYPARQAAEAVEAGDVAGGIAQYREALEITPDSAPILYNLALALASRGIGDEARKLLRRSADCNLSDSDALSELGRLHIQDVKLGAATDVLDEAISRNPAHPGALNNRGVVAFLTGRYEEAAGYFRRAVAADPDLADAWFNLADALEETGDRDGSREARRRLEAPGGK